MKFKKKILLSLSFLLIASLFILPVSADVNISDGSDLLNFLSSDFETVGNVTSDLTLITSLTPIPAISKTLNLNGHTLTGDSFLFGEAFKLEDGGTTLTINGTGTITSSSSSYPFLVKAGKLNINNVKFSQCRAGICINNISAPQVSLNGVTVDNPISTNDGFIRCLGNDSSVTFNMQNVTFTNLNMTQPLIYNEARRGTMSWNGGTVSGNFSGNGCLIYNYFTSTEFTIQNVNFENIATTNSLNSGNTTSDKYKFVNCNFTNVTCNNSPMLSFQQTRGGGACRGEFELCTVTNCIVIASSTSECSLIKWDNIDNMRIDDFTVDGFTSNSYGLFQFIGTSSSSCSIEISSLDCKNCTAEKEFTIIKSENVKQFDMDLSEIHDSTIKVPLIVTSSSDTCAYGITGCGFYNLHMDFYNPNNPAIVGFDNNSANVYLTDVSIHDNNVVSGKSDTYYCLSLKNSNTLTSNVSVKDNTSINGFGLYVSNCTKTSASNTGITFTGNTTQSNKNTCIAYLATDNEIPIKCNNNTGYDYGILINNHTSSSGLTFKNITLDSTNYGKNAIYINSSQTETTPTHLVTFDTCTFTNNTNNSATEPVLIWSGYGEGVGFSNCTISGNISNNTDNKKVIELFKGDAVIGSGVNFASDTQTIYLHDNTYLQFAASSPSTKVRVLLENQTIGDRITDQGTRPVSFTADDIKIISSIPYILVLEYPNYVLDTPTSNITVLGGDVIGVGTIKYSQSAINLTTVPSQEGMYFHGIYSDVTYSKKIAEPDGTLIPNVSGFTDGFGRWICADTTVTTTGLFEPPPPTVWQNTLNSSTSGMTVAMIIGALLSLVLAGILIVGIVKTGHVNVPSLIGIGICIVALFIIILLAGNLDATGLDMFKRVE